MLFPKRPRFDPLKVPDVPGPGTYNVEQESNWDTYKRGAFLEKTDRFNKEKPLDVPVPGTCDTTKLTTVDGLKQSAAERYAALERKLEDLEKVHADGKKSHQAEVDRLKLELIRSRQSTTDQTDRLLEKLKKQNDTLNVQIQDLKKSNLTDQAEIKDLRVKLRTADHERVQLLGKQGEAGETKKVLQVLESRRRDEVRERDRKIVELEKALAGEKKKREGVDAKLKEVKTKADEDVQKARQATQSLQGQVNQARNDAQRAQSSLANMEGKAEHKEEELLLQLEQHRCALGRVAEEYGRLASVTVPVAQFTRLKHEHAALNIHTLRLERKLANSEAQVVELANLVRSTEEQNGFLSAQLQDAQYAAAFNSRALQDAGKDFAIHNTMERSLDDKAAVIEQDIRSSERHTQELRRSDDETCREFYRLTCDQLLFVYSAAEKTLLAEQQVVQQQTVELSDTKAMRDGLASQLETIRAEYEDTQLQLGTANVALEKARAETEATEQQMVVVEERMRTEGTKNREALQKEREAAQRLAATVQATKMSEEGLKAEVEQLTAELTDAERYQEAYYSLVDEVGALVDRNNLAEGEADRLSKFNAEILGHNNPAQRIMYVDRIRRELAETKHKLLLSTRDRDAVATNNEDLQHELAMYKSVMVPSESKPRTNMIRIERPPLANQNLNLLQNGGVNATKSVNGGVDKTHILDAYIPGEMTLDEIL